MYDSVDEMLLIVQYYAGVDEGIISCRTMIITLPLLLPASLLSQTCCLQLQRVDCHNQRQPDRPHLLLRRCCSGNGYCAGWSCPLTGAGHDSGALIQRCGGAGWLGHAGGPAGGRHRGHGADQRAGQRCRHGIRVLCGRSSRTTGTSLFCVVLPCVMLC